MYSMYFHGLSCWASLISQQHLLERLFGNIELAFLLTDLVILLAAAAAFKHDVVELELITTPLDPVGLSLAEPLTPAMVAGTLTDLGREDLVLTPPLPELVPAALGSGGEVHATVARTPLVAATALREAARLPACFLPARPTEDEAEVEQSDPWDEFESSGAVVAAAGCDDCGGGACRLVGLLKAGDPPSCDSASMDSMLALGLPCAGAIRG